MCRVIVSPVPRAGLTRDAANLWKCMEQGAWQPHHAPGLLCARLVVGVGTLLQVCWYCNLTDMFNKQTTGMPGQAKVCPVCFQGAEGL